MLQWGACFGIDFEFELAEPYIMMNLLRKNVCELVLMLVGLVASFICYARTHFFSVFFGDARLRFFDTDDYITLVRIRDFFTHHDLANSVIARANVPFGGDMHWTRFYDFFLIIPSWVVSIFTNSLEQAVEYVGFCISPLVKGVTIAILLKTFAKITSRTTAIITTLVFAVHPVINYTNMFGRPDHHAFILLFLVIYMHNIAELVTSNFSDGATVIKAALVTSLCVWISPEMLIFLLLTELVLFFFLLHSEPKKLEVLRRKNVMAACAIGVIVFLLCPWNWIHVISLVALATSSGMALKNFSPWYSVVLFLIMAPAFTALSPIEYDKISVVHVVLYMFASVYLAVIQQIFEKNAEKYRLWVSLGAGMLICAVFLYLFPNFLQGMEAGVSEQLKNVWLHTNVDELKSPFEFGKRPSILFCLYLLVTTVALSHKIRDLLSGLPSPTNAFWWILLLNAACYMIFASMADRMRSTSAFFSIPIVVDWIIGGSLLRKIPRYLLSLVAFILPLSFDFVHKYHSILSGYLANADNFYDFCLERKKNYQQEDDFFRWLDGISKTPVTILTYLGKSSMTLYYTKHKVVAAPYHRQEQGILSFFTIIESPYDEDVVGKILLQTKTSYIFISRSMCYANPATAGSLAGMIAEGRYPDWISIMEIPQKFADVIVAKVNKSRLRQCISGEAF
jgi:hypothetical protein